MKIPYNQKLEDKKYTKIILTSFYLIIIFLIIYANFYKINFLDSEYPKWKAKFDLIQENKNKDIDILILGDSRTMAGIIPKKLKGNTLSLALGGGTPVESYLILEEVINKKIRVKNLIIAISPYHYMVQDSFYNRSVYFDLFDKESLKKVIENDKKYEKRGYIKELSKIEYLKKPFLYGKQLFNYQKNRNIKILEKTKLEKGHSFFGLAEESNGETFESGYKEFEVLPVHNFYMNELIKLAEKNNINLIIEQMPINEATFKNINKNFIINFKKYMQSLKEKNNLKNVNLNIWYMENKYFGDVSHVNSNGADIVTEKLKSKYNF